VESTRNAAEGREGDRSPRGTTVLATCPYCERLHAPEPLELDPMCRFCAAERANLRSLDMKGSFPLSSAAIAAELKRTSPGNYALGYLDDGRFVVFYVGRSDSDLKQCLQDWVGIPSRYDRFAPSGMAAWGSRHRGSTPLASPAWGRVGRAEQSSYTHFAYSYASSAEAAVAKEHQNYDDFGGCAALDNERAPRERAGSAGPSIAPIE
jgi:hypothetical protein